MWHKPYDITISYSLDYLWLQRYSRSTDILVGHLRCSRWFNDWISTLGHFEEVQCYAKLALPTNAFTLHCSFMSQYHRVLPWIVNKNIDKIRNMFSRLQFVPDIKRNWSYIAKSASCELIIENRLSDSADINQGILLFSSSIYCIIYVKYCIFLHLQSIRHYFPVQNDIFQIR